MMNVEISAGTIFTRTVKAFNDGKKIIIHKGGTGSGKTFDLMVFLLFYIASSRMDWVITIVSESVPHLDIGTKRYAKQLFGTEELSSIAAFNQTKGIYTFNNGTIIEFFSADRIGKALGARRNILYGNEINHIKLDIWEELARRSEIVIGDFNPTAEFWLEQWLSYQDNYIVIKSNYMHNKYLPETERRKIAKRAEVDPNFKRIHIDCEYGNYEGLIFPNIELVDELPATERRYFGLDFGYTQDPTALVEHVETGESHYFDELIYRTNLRNSDISALMQQASIHRFDTIYADSAEPKTIDELSLMGWNIYPTVKGADSIVYGIDLMKSKPIRVTKRSVNLIREFRNYSYTRDKQGRWLNVPIDIHNHAIDAARYVVMSRARAKLEYTRTYEIDSNNMTL